MFKRLNTRFDIPTTNVCLAITKSGVGNLGKVEVKFWWKECWTSGGRGSRTRERAELTEVIRRE